MLKYYILKLTCSSLFRFCLPAGRTKSSKNHSLRNFCRLKCTDICQQQQKGKHSFSSKTRGMFFKERYVVKNSIWSYYVAEQVLFLGEMLNSGPSLVVGLLVGDWCDAEFWFCLQRRRAPSAWIQICQLNWSQQPISMMHPHILCNWISGTLFWCWNYWAVWREIENTYDNIWEQRNRGFRHTCRMIDQIIIYSLSLSFNQPWDRFLLWVDIIWSQKSSWSCESLAGVGKQSLTIVWPSILRFDNSLIKHFEVRELGREILQPPIVG